MPGVGIENIRAPAHGRVAWAVGFAETAILYVLFGMRTRQSDIAAFDVLVQAVKDAGFYCLFVAIAFAVACWPARREIKALWVRFSPPSDEARWFGLNALVFSLLAPATLTIVPISGGVDFAQWPYFVCWCLAVVAMLAALARAAAPLAFWRHLIETRRTELIVAIGAALSIGAAAMLSQASWTTLSTATIQLTYWILTQYETGITIDASNKILGVGDYRVLIAPACSGYEGIGMVLGFVGLYLFVFRRQLRFPRALLLLPIGAVVIWLLNGARLAALISIGAHWSPEIASRSFHSQAGWIMFLATAITIMIAANGMSFFRSHPTVRETRRDPALRTAGAYLLPLAALMCGRIIAAAFSINDQWLYAIGVLAGVGVLWLYRDVYQALIAMVSPLSVLAGALVGVVWILTDPRRTSASAPDYWITNLPPTMVIAWFALRVFGSVFLVPVAEELAFRGYLHRALIARQFETVRVGHFTWIAFAVTTALFGIMHSRWLSGALAGAVYAITMYRSKRLSDPIAAHMTSNAVIAAWAIGAAQYSLL